MEGLAHMNCDAYLWSQLKFSRAVCMATWYSAGPKPHWTVDHDQHACL